MEIDWESLEKRIEEEIEDLPRWACLNSTQRWELKMHLLDIIKDNVRHEAGGITT